MARGGYALAPREEILGYANISQTDTYLNAGRIALQDSMKHFDAVRRGKLVANDPQIESRPLRHGDPEETPKDQLH
jgi:hypothetical protein